MDKKFLDYAQENPKKFYPKEFKEVLDEYRNGKTHYLIELQYQKLLKINTRMLKNP